MDKKTGSRTDSQLEARLQSILPLAAGLLITRGLGLQGWKAITTYLLATGVTEEILKHFTLPLPDLSQSQQSSGSSSQSPCNPSGGVNCRIIHHIPGRIRLSIPRLTRDREYGKAIERLLEQERHITGVRLNPMRGTVVMTYLANAFFEGKSRSQAEQLSLDAAYLLDRIRSVDGQEASGTFTGQTQGNSPLDSSLKLQPSSQEIEASPLEQPVPIAPETDKPEDIASPPPDEAAADSATDAEGSSAEVLAALEPTAIEGSGYWSRFKACMCAMMLKMMANLPVQTVAS